MILGQGALGLPQELEGRRLEAQVAGGGAVEPGTMAGIYHPAAITALALGLFCLIYLFYILMAYTSLKRNVLPQE